MDKHTVIEGQAVFTGVVTFAGDLVSNGYTNSVIQFLTDDRYRPRYEARLGKDVDMPNVLAGDRVRITVWLAGSKSNPATDKPETRVFHNLRLAKCEVLDAQPRADAPPAQTQVDAADTAMPAADEAPMPF